MGLTRENCDISLTQIPTYPWATEVVDQTNVSSKINVDSGSSMFYGSTRVYTPKAGKDEDSQEVSRTARTNDQRGR